MPPGTLGGSLPIGSPCDPDAAEDPCAGACVPLVTVDSGPTPGMCAGFCSIGASPACGESPTASKPAAACLFDWTIGGGDVGDIGLCGQLCDCNDECTAEGRTCRPFPASEFPVFGRKGYCGGKIDSATGGPADNLPCAP